MCISNQPNAHRRLILKLGEAVRAAALLALLQGYAGAAHAQSAPAPLRAVSATGASPAPGSSASAPTVPDAAVSIAVPVPSITISHASVSASGTINDDGSALTAPDMSLYQGQLATLQKLQQDKQALQLEVERVQLEASEKKAEPKPLRKIARPPAVQPYLVNLTGVGDERRARIAIPGYGEITVQPEDVLPNRWHVVSIDDDGVVVQTNPGHRIRRIAYQAQMPAAQLAPVPARPAAAHAHAKVPVTAATAASHRMTARSVAAAAEVPPAGAAPVRIAGAATSVASMSVTMVPITRTPAQAGAVSAPSGATPNIAVPMVAPPTSPAPAAADLRAAAALSMVQSETALSLSVPVHRARGELGEPTGKNRKKVRESAGVRRAGPPHKRAMPADARPTHGSASGAKPLHGVPAKHKKPAKAHPAGPRKKSHCHFICQ